MLGRMFYIKFDSDLNVFAKYNANDWLENEYVFELSNIFEDEINNISKKNKQFDSEVILDRAIDFGGGIRSHRFILSQYLNFINNYISRELALELLGEDQRRLNSIYRIVNFYSLLSNKYMKIFQPFEMMIGNKSIKPFSNLKEKGLIDFIVQLSILETRVFLVKYRVNGRTYFMVIGGDFEDGDYDVIIPYLISHDIDDLNIKKVHITNPNVNFIGDTYLGESYTKKRMQRKQNDALMQYGYSYSFSGISDFIRKDEFNIINFEATFNITDYTPFLKKKDYLLYANSENNIGELKERGLNCICLANNHSLDYGEKSLLKTIHDFENSNFIVMGGGQNQYEANKILELDFKGKKLAIFNAYWKNRYYVDYEFYALHDRAGVNILNGVLFHQIEKYKKENLESLVMVFCHWGLDFKPVQKYQTYLAQRMINVGVDLIVGHGSHSIQYIDSYKNKNVIYGIGNGVFNSDGEYDIHHVLPYGLLVKLDMEKQEVKLYPICTNNLKTFWKPRFVSHEELCEVKEFLKENKLEEEKDELGHFFKIKL
ncbi:CapA family protein [Acinetobacter halotolerans]|uniref:CapA family protein n=1 Tax=Acinetobacter halotolerans TaxID=1752076 RepID=A0A4Q6XCM0_9GAMM|nr:CapA family protein [Acinetobacter halotolerans]RZF55624.1 CapA family protein [Acinetobacter halotolerans]